MSSPVKIVAILVPHEGKDAELSTLLKAMAVASRAEPGNLRWDIWREQGEPGRMLLDELYADAAAARSHRETAHFKDYLSRIGSIAERTAITLDPADLA